MNPSASSQSSASPTGREGAEILAAMFPDAIPHQIELSQHAISGKRLRRWRAECRCGYSGEQRRSYLGAAGDAKAHARDCLRELDNQARTC